MCKYFLSLEICGHKFHGLCLLLNRESYLISLVWISRIPIKNINLEQLTYNAGVSLLVVHVRQSFLY